MSRIDVVRTIIQVRNSVPPTVRRDLSDIRAGVTPGDRDDIGIRAADIILAAQGRFTSIWLNGRGYPTHKVGIMPVGFTDYSKTVLKDASFARNVVSGLVVFSRPPHTEIFRGTIDSRRRVVFQPVPMVKKKD